MAATAKRNQILNVDDLATELDSRRSTTAGRAHVNGQQLAMRLQSFLTACVAV